MHQGANQRLNILALTKDDPDEEVAIRGRLLGLIELQQERGGLVRHIRLELRRVERLLIL